MRETWVRSLGREDRLDKEMATHSSILAWTIPWMEEPSPWGRKESDTTERPYYLFNWKQSDSMSPCENIHQVPYSPMK